MNEHIRKVLNDIKAGKKLTIWFDIDGTLASTKDNNYTDACPDEAMIALLNMLYDQGHTIYIISARGGSSGIDWKKTTEDQLMKWGVHYHKLLIGYPRDFMIDDSMLRPDEFLNEI